MRQWINQHAQALSSVLSRMRRNLLSTLMMLGVIGIALSLPGVLYVVADNLSRLAGSVQSASERDVLLRSLQSIERPLRVKSQRELTGHWGICSGYLKEFGQIEIFRLEIDLHFPSGRDERLAAAEIAPGKWN